jgi:hypothetical protein
MNWAHLLLVPLAATFSLASAARDDADVAAELRSKLSLPIDKAAARKDELLEKDRRILERALGEASGLAERVIVYGVTVDEDQVRNESPVRVAVLAFDGPLQGGMLAVAVRGGGAVVGQKVWGCEELDGAPRDWDLFLDQFSRQPSLNRVMNPDRAVSAKELARLLEQLETDETKDGASVRALYRQRLIMRDNSYRYSIMRSRMAEPDRIAWLRDWKAGFSSLSEISRDVGRVLETGVEQTYRRAAKTGESILDEVIASLENEDDRAARQGFKKLYKSSCQGCHEIEHHGLGEKTLYKNAMESLPELSVRDDFARVGTDVFALPGREDSCQAVATGLKACLLVLGAR